jgi:hypothetical protein
MPAGSSKALREQPWVSSAVSRRITFRKRAEKMRAKADNLTGRESKQTLLKAAQSYDKMADTAEKIRKAEQRPHVKVR